ncbi:MAG: hypothetical protein IJZ29_03060 [Clostridia bacterium]|nr:hypothetical protein [Clostridia bacterium]
MKLSKNHIFLFVLNIICSIIFVGFVVISIKSLSGLINPTQIFINIISTVLFLIPYFVFLTFSICVFRKQVFNQVKHKGLTAFQWIIVVLTAICVIISILFICYGVYGISSMLKSIVGIKEGYIVSDIYSKEQLLAFSTKGLYQNIYSVFSTCVFAIGNVWAAASLFIKSKQ